MATPFRDHDHGRVPHAPEDPPGLPLRRAAPFSSILGRGFGPLIGALGSLLQLFGRAADVSGKDPVVASCLASAMKLIRRRLRPRGRWDTAPGPGRPQPRAW